MHVVTRHGDRGSGVGAEEGAVDQLVQRLLREPLRRVARDIGPVAVGPETVHAIGENAQAPRTTKMTADGVTGASRALSARLFSSPVDSGDGGRHDEHCDPCTSAATEDHVATEQDADPRRTAGAISCKSGASGSCVDRRLWQRLEAVAALAPLKTSEPKSVEVDLGGVAARTCRSPSSPPHTVPAVRVMSSLEAPALAWVQLFTSKMSSIVRSQL